MSNVSAASQADAFLDTTTPNMARIFDFLTGGSANFEADRRAANHLMRMIPSIRKWTRLRLAFVRAATEILYESNFRHFLDLGTGMPKEDHIHTIAPDAHVVYADINPVAVSYGDSLFNQLPQVHYIQGDVRRLPALLAHKHVQALKTAQLPIAIGLNALVLFLSPVENMTVAHALYEWAPPGSCLFLTLQTRGDLDMPTGYQQFVEITQQAGLPMQLYTLAANKQMMLPWRVERLEPIIQFLGLPDDYITHSDREGIDMALYATFLSKPADDETAVSAS